MTLSLPSRTATKTLDVPLLRHEAVLNHVGSESFSTDSILTTVSRVIFQKTTSLSFVC